MKAKSNFAVLLLVFLSSCMAHSHIVGQGPLGSVEIEQKQYYMFFGLIELNEVDTKKMARPHTNYEITTCFTMSDIFLAAPFLVPFTIIRRTVSVRK